MTKIRKEDIEQLIEARTKIYRDADETVSAFNRENELSKEYNGRQMLELIQNADDAHAKRIVISLDKKEKILSVYNDGESFTLEGIKSIMIPNLSSKVTSYYIGNKGLGFRSMLAWSDNITIETGIFSFDFSREIAREIAKNLAEESGVDFDSIRSKRNIPPEICPFPMLAIPKFTTRPTDSDKGCKIIVHYKTEYEKAIDEQMRRLDESALLFLNNVQHIEISINGEKEKELNVEKKEGFVTSERGQWLIEKVEHELPDEYQDPYKTEKKKYSIILALPQGNSEKTYLLHNYLPTAERIGLPYLIHATLELDSSRNHINNSVVNEFILKKTAELISSYVDRLLGDNSSFGWKAYEMMTPTGEDQSSIIGRSLFENLKKLRDEKNILPTISGSYANKDDYFFYDNDDSSFWKDFPLSDNDLLGRILHPVPEWIQIPRREIDEDQLVESLNSLQLHTIEDRGSLICHLIDTKRLKAREDLSLLLDENKRIIESESSVFTPKSPGVNYELPDYVKIQFLHKDLFDDLVEKLDYKEAIDYMNDSGSKRSASRWLSEELRKNRIATISDYDKDQVLRVIVFQTNSKMRNDAASHAETIWKMVSSLFSIYDKEGFNTILDNVPLLNQNNEVKKAGELLFSSELNQAIFPDADFLSKDLYGIASRDREVFFKKLGVNQIIVKKTIKDRDLWDYATYLQNGKIFSDENCTPDKIKEAMKDIDIRQLSDGILARLQNASLESIIRFLSSEDMYQELHPAMQEKILYKYYIQREADTEYSYLRYQFLTLPNVKNKILPDETLLDEINIDDIPAEKCSVILRFLTTNFSGISDNDLVEILNKLAESGRRRNIRKIYKVVVDGLSKGNRSLKGKTLNLHATDVEGNSGYFPVKEVFYTDNNAIPSQILQNKNLKRLDYGSRSGAEKICKALGITPLNEFKPEITCKEDHDIQKAFSTYFEEMKPYILLYCIQDINKIDDKKKLASIVRKSRIVLVSGCEYKIDGQDYSLKPNEFVVDPNEDALYFLNASKISSQEEMFKDVKFCYAVTEIISMICKIVGKNDVFVRIFQNLAFMKLSVEVDFLKEQIDEAFSLLGMPSEEYDFCKALLGNACPERNETEKIHQEVCNFLGITKELLEKVDFVEWCTEESYQLLLKAQEKNNTILSQIDLSERHKTIMEDVKRDWKDCFVHALWRSLEGNKEAQKSYISRLCDYDKISFDLDCHTLLTREGYIEALEESINTQWGIKLLPSECKKPQRLYPDYEKWINELTAEQQSLFYFPGNEEEIKQMHNKMQDIMEGAERTKEESEFNDVELEFIEEAKLEKGTFRLSKKGHKSTGVKTHSEQTEKRKKEQGRLAELLVKKGLEQNGYEFKWRSGFSDEADRDDSLGYDFEYKETDSSEWRYLEVKNFSSDHFILSANEYAAATEKYKGKYDVALVVDKNIFIRKNFFDSPNYTKIPKEYFIYCKINQ